MSHSITDTSGIPASESSVKFYDQHDQLIFTDMLYIVAVYAMDVFMHLKDFINFI